MSLIKWQPKRYYGWVGGQKIVKNALRNLWMAPNGVDTVHDNVRRIAWKSSFSMVSRWGLNHWSALILICKLIKCSKLYKILDSTLLLYNFMYFWWHRLIYVMICCFVLVFLCAKNKSCFRSDDLISLKYCQVFSELIFWGICTKEWISRSFTNAF